MNYMNISSSVSTDLSQTLSDECSAHPHRKRKNSSFNMFTLNFLVCIKTISLSVNLRKNLIPLDPVIMGTIIIKLHL